MKLKIGMIGKPLKNLSRLFNNEDSITTSSNGFNSTIVNLKNLRETIPQNVCSMFITQEFMITDIDVDSLIYHMMNKKNQQYYD